MFGTLALALIAGSCLLGSQAAPTAVREVSFSYRAGSGRIDSVEDGMVDQSLGVGAEVVIVENGRSGMGLGINVSKHRLDDGATRVRQSEAYALYRAFGNYRAIGFYAGLDIGIVFEQYQYSRYPEGGPIPPEDYPSGATVPRAYRTGFLTGPVVGASIPFFGVHLETDLRLSFDGLEPLAIGDDELDDSMDAAYRLTWRIGLRLPGGR